MSDHRQYCHLGRTAQQCRSVLSQDSDLAGDFEDSKSTSRRFFLSSELEKFVPKSGMFKKQTSVSHSSTESEVISLDAGFRMDGIPALDLWDLVIEVLHSKKTVRRNPWRDETQSKHTNTKTEMILKILCGSRHHKRKTYSLRSHALLEDNEAVIKIIIEGRILTMRHVSRTDRVAFGRLLTESIETPKSKSNMSTPKTKSQAYWTKGNFTRDESNHLLRAFNIMSFFRCSLAAISVQSTTLKPCRRG